MRFRRLSDLLRSLRFRLAAWNTAVVLLTIIGTLVGVREALRLTLRHETDEVLREDALEILLGIEQHYPDMPEIFQEMERKAAGHVQRGMFVQLFDAGGQPLWSSPSTPPPEVFDSAARDGTVTVDGARYRVVERQLDQSSIPAFTVRVGSSMASADEDVAKVTRTMTLVGLLIMLVAPLGGYWLAGRATRPLAQLIRTAARLRPRRMEERLPLQGTGDELDQLSVTINRFLDLLADYLERNREFVANAAHELRSPLAAIRSTVEVALNNDRTIDQYKDLLADIVDQCSGLGALVNQLLLLAESDAGNMQLVSDLVPLDYLARHAVDMFQGAAEERGVTLRTERLDPIAVRGDARRLQQVINNLIDNSVKFSRPGGQVTIDVRFAPAAQTALLRVNDTGPGIEARDLPHVFERFYRGDKSRHREQQVGGTGLGLSICQSIVAAHAGTIEIHSLPGQGTQVTVELPAAVGDVRPATAMPVAAMPH